MELKNRFTCSQTAGLFNQNFRTHLRKNVSQQVQNPLTLGILHVHSVLKEIVSHCISKLLHFTPRAKKKTTNRHYLFYTRACRTLGETDFIT